jgi:hypothetical protein
MANLSRGFEIGAKERPDSGVGKEIGVLSQSIGVATHDYVVVSTNAGILPFLHLEITGHCRDHQSDTLSTLRNLADENKRLGVNMASDISSLKMEILSSIQELSKNIAPEQGLNKSGLEFLKLANRTPKEAPETFDIVVVAQRLAELAKAGNKIATAQRILESLRFKTMKVRYSRITDAHPRTFRWMFSKSGENPYININFVEWLQSDETIYWISGKPGSGKSVLMKYLVDAEQTTTLLRSWAGPKKLATGSFFLWIAGTEMQKSQEGLFRSLFYEVFRQCPELIPFVFPLRWQMGESYHHNPEPWTRSELLQAFTRLKSHDIASTRFCFFIDGLDEYEGDHAELVEVIKDLVDSSHVKICLSSRPWNVFEAAFGNDPIRKLYLQDMNKVDISLFVKNKLEDRQDFKELKQRDIRCDKLVAEIIEKARGVFLWVWLVVRSLIEGLNNCDRISDLQRRLRDFPEDLEKFFFHIFTSLDPIYRKQTARAFQISLQARRPLSLLIYWFLDEDEDDSNFAVGMPINASDEAELSSRQKKTRIRLNGHCKGLLETSQFHVDFLHRTVKDFLMTKDMQNLLTEWAGIHFDTDAAIFITTLARIKSIPVGYRTLRTRGPLFELIEDLVYHSREFELRTNGTAEDVLDELDRVITHYAEQYPGKNGPTNPWRRWATSRNSHHKDNDSMLTFCIEKNLILYVQKKLDQNLSLLKKERGRPLLDYALRVSNLLPRERLPLLGMAAMLLDRGADPNQKWDYSTVWRSFMVSWQDDSEQWPQDVLYGSVRLLLMHGADRKISIRGSDLCECLQKTLSSDDVAALNEVLSPKRVAAWTRIFTRFK